MDSAKKELMIRTCRQFMEIGLGGEDPGVLRQIVDEHVVGLGTAIDEKIRGIEEVIKLIDIQNAQSEGLKISSRIVPISQYTTADEDTAIFADDVYLTIQTGEKTIDMYVRFSVVLNYVDGLWKVIHWHGSKPEQVESEKDTWGVDIWKQKVEELEHLVGEKTADLLQKNRELQIEAALERVRARSMAMRSSEELTEVISLLLAEIRKLDTPAEHAGFYIDYKQRDDWHIWLADPNQIPREFTVPYFDCLVWHNYNNAKDQGLDAFAHTYSFEEKNDFYEKMFRLFPVPEEARTFYMNCPGLSVSTVLLDNVGLYVENFTGTPYTEYENRIVKRFGKVFQQTYTRFQDLQKAEEQAREAQTEAALEKIRSSSLAMHRTDELKSVIAVMHEKLKDLSLQKTTVAIVTFDENTKSIFYWIGNDLNEKPIKVTLPYRENTLEKSICQRELWSAITNKKSFHNRIYDVHAKNEWFAYILEHNNTDIIPENQREFLRRDSGLIASLFVEMHSSIWVDSWEGERYSAEQISVLARIAKVFDQAYVRFLDLHKAEEQTREAEIQLALERVRARAMAMHSSQELKEVVHVLRKQMGMLGQSNLETCVIHLHDESADYIQSWAGISPPDSGGEILETNARVPKKGLLIIEEAMAAYAAKRQEYVIRNEGEKLAQWFSFLEQASPDGYKIISDSAHGDIAELTSYWSFADFDGGSLLMVTRDEPNEATRGLLRRFSQVFGLAYRRFADLKKAEAQAREAQIEASLERVRSKTMAMHNSQEVGESVATLFEELISLGVLYPDERCGIGIMHPDHRMEAWTAAKTADGKAELTIGYLDMSLHPLLRSAYKGWVEKKEVNQYLLEGDDKMRYHEAMLSQPNYKIKRDYYSGPKRINHSDFYFKEGCLYIFSQRDLTPESQNVYTRFATVFGQTYRRYQDLLKAEAQAREAQIEAALESVRSKAMAMRTSEDIAETTAASFVELKKLGISSFRSGVGILTKGSRMAQVFADTRAEDGQTKALSTLRSMDEHPALQQQYIAWEKQEDYEQFLSGDELIAYYSHPFFQKSNIDLQKKNQQGQECGYYFAFPDGLFYSWSYQPYTESEKSILRRFRNIISLTFRRYLDLQKAEAQAREATKQTSLDRVRAVIASMRSTEDLEMITPLVFRELTTLDVPFIRCGVFIIHEDRQIIDAYLSSPTGESLGALHLPFDASELTMETVKAWRKGQVHRQHWNQEDFIAWTKQMMEQHQIESSRTYQGADSAPESLDLHFVPFTQGMLYVGSMKMLGDQELELVLALAKSFSIAYARYEDFIKLENAKASIESTLTELKATQAQLIQQEKLASLGQLTAGIAHEIQNPLNFVNNFSEINAELSDEILDAAAKGDIEEVKALASDIKSNQEKIREHGKRADSIVKGMLQHSRSSAGNKEPTDLAALSDEYLRLAYHGMRAKDKTFNATLKTEFDPQMPLVPVVSQDISRVLLNLFNNAFYAVHEKSKTAGPGYEPTVTVRTSLTPAANGEPPNAVISVEDNGPGIPESIKEKIFQPFFTTKPTGQGTGLGLSLSYDIINAHGGTMTAESEEGNGSLFMLKLPIIQNA